MKGPEKKRAKIAVDPSSERQMVDLQRRLLLRGGLSLGALAMLSGCRLQDGDSVDKVLWAMSRWNDRVQAWLFSRMRLAPTFDPSQVASPFPFNAFYPAYNVPEIDLPEYRLQVSGRVRDKRPWSLEQLRRLPQASQVTQLICIEGWSAIGQWSGVPLRTFLELVGADTSAKYVGFKCADRYYSSLDMPSALHPQTLLALEMSGQALPEENGYPLRLRIPHQARLQERQARGGDLRQQQQSRRLLGGPGLQLVQRSLRRESAACLGPCAQRDRDGR